MVRPRSMELRERAVARIADGPGASHYPSAMFSPFSVSTVRSNKLVQVVDLSSSKSGVNGPCSMPPCHLNYDRMWGNATVLADGKVLVSAPQSTTTSTTRPEMTSTPTKWRSIIRIRLPEPGRSATPLPSPIFIIRRRCSFRTGRC
jgi:hypothetical protein